MKKIFAISICLLTLAISFSGCASSASDSIQSIGTHDAIQETNNIPSSFGDESKESISPIETESNADSSALELGDIENDVDSIESESEGDTQESAVEKAYNEACSLTINDLEKRTSSFTGSTFYYYNELIIQPEDAEWLNESWNTEHSLNQGAIYRTIANYLDGFKSGINTGKDYAEILCGKEWTSKEEFEPYATNAAQFICLEDSLTQIFKKLQSLSCVSGSFDYENKKYNLSISNLTDCANEMMISEEMLGYIFAFMDEYAPKIIFTGNSCEIDYESYIPNS